MGWGLDIGFGSRLKYRDTGLGHGSRTRITVA